MDRSDPNLLAGLSHDDDCVVVRSENDAKFPVEPELQFDFDERTTHARMIARLRLLWENRLFLARTTGIALLLSLAIAFLIPTRYQSVARLMPPDNQSGSGLAMAAAALTDMVPGARGAGGLANELLGTKNTSDLMVGVLDSRTVADELIRKFNLQKVYRDRRMEDTRKDLASHTDVSVDRKSQIIVIAVTDKNPHRAAAMAQTYIEELNRLVAVVSTSAARRERIFLEGRLRGVNQDLEAAEKAFSQFASKNTAIDIKEQGKAMVEAAANLQGRLIAARSELEGLRQIYADSNVRVRSAQARVAELEDQLKKVGGDDTSLQSGNQSDSIYPSIRKLPLLGVTYADLYRETRVQETVFETLTQEYELAKVQEAKEIPTVKVLDRPNLPDKKSFPPRTLIILLGTALAFAGGITWVLGRARWEAIDPADPGKALAQEVFAAVKSSVPWGSRNGFASNSKSGGANPGKSGG